MLESRVRDTAWRDGGARQDRVRSRYTNGCLTKKAVVGSDLLSALHVNHAARCRCQADQPPPLPSAGSIPQEGTKAYFRHLNGSYFWTGYRQKTRDVRAREVIDSGLSFTSFLEDRWCGEMRLDVWSSSVLHVS